MKIGGNFILNLQVEIMLWKSSFYNDLHGMVLYRPYQLSSVCIGTILQPVF